MKIDYQVIQKADFSDTHRQIFADMLEKQNKVKGNLIEKVDRCQFICIVHVNNEHVAIGAIKQKTKSDFTEQKAGVAKLSENFEWELGYLYTLTEYQKRGIASMVVRLLIEKFGDGNLMASTEISANPSMVCILEKNGFRLLGKPWKSNIHVNFLGLFLKFK